MSTSNGATRAGRGRRCRPPSGSRAARVSWPPDVADEFPVRRYHAAEVLRPWFVGGRVDHRARSSWRAAPAAPAENPGRRRPCPLARSASPRSPECTTQLMSFRGSTPTYAAMLDRNRCWSGPQARHGHRLSLQIADRADPVGPEELETADVHAGKHDDRSPDVERDSERTRRGPSRCSTSPATISSAPGRPPARRRIPDVGESLGPQQLLGDVLRERTDGRLRTNLIGRLRRRLGGSWPARAIRAAPPLPRRRAKVGS